MIKGENFIFTGLQPWDISIGSNAKDIALEVSKHNKVLYINTPLDKKTFISKKDTQETRHRKEVIKGKSPYLRQINPNLWVLDYPFTIWPVNFLPDGPLFDWVNKMNNKRMYSFVRKILKQLHFNEYILFIDNDMFRSLYAKDYLHPSLTIYYRRDNMVSKFWQKHARRIEALICSKSDFVLTNSLQLANAVSSFNEKSYNIGQGIDLSNYDINKITATPDDMKHIPHPIVGYTGMLTAKRLDIHLIYELAQQMLSYSFVLVGPEDDIFKAHDLHTLKNIYFLGEKNPLLIPTYIYAFDICINPQLINSITIGNYPRKIDEYLALGKPVVATKTDTMSLFEKYTKNCIGIEEYKEAIKMELAENNEQIKNERILFAQTHSWKQCVSNMYQYIDLFINK